jgi:hypothetical protein
MGFMNFGKKGTSKEIASLDIPPPPPIGGQKSQFPPKPQAEDIFKPFPPPENIFSQQPVFPAMQGQDKDFGVQAKDDSLALPNDIPLFQGQGEQKDTSFEDLFKPLPPPAVQQPEKKMAQPKILVAPIPRPAPSASSASPIFIEVTKYKRILNDLNGIKKSLKDTDEEINEIIGDINDEEKVFSALNAKLSDTEDKISKLEDSIFG